MDEKTTLWFDADGELLESLAKEADFRDESIAEFVVKACERHAD